MLSVPTFLLYGAEQWRVDSPGACVFVGENKKIEVKVGVVDILPVIAPLPCTASALIFNNSRVLFHNIEYRGPGK